MKKVLVITGVAIAFFAFSTILSPEANATTVKSNVEWLQGPEEIALSALPAEVQKAWEDFKQEGDVASKAYKDAKDDGSVVYEIEYTTADSQTKSVKFDADGNEA